MYKKLFLAPTVPFNALAQE